MAAVETHASQGVLQLMDPEPDENWDDDFEFGAAGGGNRKESYSHMRTPRKTGLPSDYAKLSVGSRAETEDWDVQADESATHGLATSVHLTKSTATLRDLKPQVQPLALVPTPSLPRPEPETENWDDDFEDARNSPQKPSSGSKFLLPSPPRHKLGDPPESWDDDNDAEFGLAHDEEDRTVTARSRRAAQPKSRHLPSTPPPPTPQLPLNLIPGGNVFLAPHDASQSFPNAHSPTSSVFSNPGTVQTTHSSAPLVSQSSSPSYPSASAKVFSLLPPSPQVHKERERRRLRKRSRPGERERMREREGVFELMDVHGGPSRSRASFGGRMSMDEEVGYGRRSFDSERAFSEEEEDQEEVPSPPPVVGPPRTSSFRPSTAPTTSAQQVIGTLAVPATPSKQTLLGRIGSVKRWVGGGVNIGRRRGMSTGADGTVGDARHTQRPFDNDVHRTPRPQSSLSSFSHHGSTSTHSQSYLPYRNQHAGNHYPYGYRPQPQQSRSPSSPASPSKSPPNNTGGGGGGWFFRASSRASSTGSPTSAGRRGFRSSSRAGASDAGTDVPAPAGATPLAQHSPSPDHTQRKLSRSRSRTGPRTPRHSAGGDRDAGIMTHAHPLAIGGTGNTTGVGRRRSTRAPSRGGMRASLDFNASRTSLGMTMSILEAEDRERERQRAAVHTPSPNPAAGRSRGRGYSVGEGGEETRTPARLIKRKSLGFVQLTKAMTAADKDEPKGEQGSGEGEGRSARYGGLGLGRAFGGKEKDVEGEKGAVEERTRRKSFSRLLRDRDKAKDKEKENQHVAPVSPQTPSKDKEAEKEGSRGFMGSVRRISLVGRHKRTKSGNGIGPGNAPSSPSSPFFSTSRRTSASNAPAGKHDAPIPPLPYSLPPLPSSESQLSLRLAASSTGHLPLPSSLLTKNVVQGRRVVSTASSKSQGSSLMPASSVASSSASTSATSSRNPSGNGPHQTPTQLKSALARRPSSRRSRVSEDEGTNAGRPSLGSVGRASLDFESRMQRSIDQDALERGQQGKATPPPPMPLLPPIELQPPSPPQTIGPAKKGAETSIAAPTTFDSLSPTTSSSSLFFTPTSSPHPPASPNKLSVGHSPGKSPGSQQSASLGRVTAATATAVGDGSSPGKGASPVPRRNSLGDLKIPVRISQAQVNIKRDLEMVKEFANSVEQLKEMQLTYNGLVAEVQTIFDAHIQQHTQLAPLPRTTSPSFFGNLSTKGRPKTRARSNTNPNPGQSLTPASASLQDVTTSQLAYKEMAAMFYTINSRYRISWECAELLIELGGGTPAPNAASPPTSVSAPFIHQAQAAVFDTSGKKRSRERAITLSGEQSNPKPTASTSIIASSNLPISPPRDADPTGPPPASPPNISWRASTGRHDLSQRQLVLLREMLNNANATSIADQTGPSIPEESLPSVQSLHVNNEWRWGDARNSTITLPSEESGGLQQERRASAEHKRKHGRLGMSGIRDMLRALKRSHTETLTSSTTTSNGPVLKAVQSTTSLSTQSSGASRRHRYAHPRLPSNRRRAKTSTGPETVRASKEHEPHLAAAMHDAQPTFMPPKPSPRRPSLASIFRIGNKNRVPSMSTEDVTSTSAPTSSAYEAQSSGTGEDGSSASEEDWDRMDSASDLDAAAKALGMGVDGLATVRGGSNRKIKKGRSPYLQHDSFEPPPLPLPIPSPPGRNSGYSMRHSVIPKRSFNMSSSSLRNGDQPQNSPHGSSHMVQRTIRLSNVEELVDEPNSPTKPGAPQVSSLGARLSTHIASPSSIRSKAQFGGSVRSMPPQLATSATVPVINDSKLAMTPENIKPLLDNAREVLAKLNDCIVEIQSLIKENVTGPSGDVT